MFIVHVRIIVPGFFQALMLTLMWRNVTEMRTMRKPRKVKMAIKKERDVVVHVPVDAEMVDDFDLDHPVVLPDHGECGAGWEAAPWDQWDLSRVAVKEMVRVADRVLENAGNKTLSPKILGLRVKPKTKLLRMLRSNRSL